ncbi:MinD/ParA family protein [Mycobacteroides immunogenum]|uniref:Cobalamin biosynthesis protein CobQ n=1 Tax=Mycobacteroides immunogenum TaxID=83262 RepID=A0ABR5LXV4_9MYCO|nr:AAA family ATPase [Mycobacteroides immunogenum]KPG29253.1 cobalamin biosynthesis protein CobQ [Mycobacteroides immunogenum]KPG36777.1 cobalamin biosynthesis protein CobQ [Mycobacteroides immunogenum]KPG62627.1 cobalamin biosynthesis protein CobQ [Mycobacteroides immunogenum]
MSTGQYSQEQLQQLPNKYRNAEFVDRPAGPSAPVFADAPAWSPSPEAVQSQWSPEARTMPSAATYEAREFQPAGPDDGNRSARLGVREEGPQQGWRMYLNKLPGVHLRKGDDEKNFDRRIAQIRRTLAHPKTVAVLSGKGSAGKTITALNLGATVAKYQRGEKIVAASIDPLGNITDRTRGVNDQKPRSVVSLAADTELRRDSAAVGSYLLTDSSGLRVLGSSSADGATFLTSENLEKAHSTLRDYFHFNLTVLDFGLNIDSSVYHTGLALADQLILVASTTADSIDELDKLIETLKRFGGKYIDLVKNAVVVFVQTIPGKGHIDVNNERTRIVNTYKIPVVTIPWDAHISEGGPMSLELLDKQTQLRYVELAAEVMTKLPD